jgi:MinD superfamily P-loop ATPase
VDDDRCTKCGACVDHCKFGAITPDIRIRDGACEGCGVCEYICPAQAISMQDHVIGQIFQRRTDHGPLIDARLDPGEESSGKLVTAVRERSKQVTRDIDAKTILIDGAPGIACNVISTLTGVPRSILVTEPSQSGLHDLARVVSLARIFHTHLEVVINKHDLNPEMSERIATFCQDEGIDVVLRIPFLPELLDAINDLTIPSEASIPFFQSDDWLTFVQHIQKG